jgi:dTDP-L-rhamnose 4-epimerase
VCRAIPPLGFGAVRVLVTGGAGFIGSRLSTVLVREGHDVVVVDALHPQVHARPGRPVDLPPEAVLVPTDVSDGDQLERALSLTGAPDVLVHLAAETGTGQSLRAASRHGRVNVVGTTEVLDAFSRRGITPARIVLASSRAVYGEGRWRAGPNGAAFYPGPRTVAQLEAGRWDPVAPDGGPAVATAHEAAAVWPRPTNVYAATKLAQEHILGAWCASFGCPLSVLRLQNVYGPGQAVENSYTGVLTFFARRLAAGEPIEVYEDGRIIRDFVYVDDVVEAMRRAVADDRAESFTVDIGSGSASTLEQVAVQMSALTTAPPPRIVGRFRAGDVRAAWADVAAAHASLGWEPATSLEDGLGRTLTWVAAQTSMVAPA